MIIVWRVTSRCNLSCPFCSYDRTQGGMRKEAEWEDVLTFARVLRAYQDETDDRVLLSWIGGEPLRWRHYHEATRFVANELGLRVSATTNGSTLGADEERRFAVEHLSELTVSLDAAGSLHDRLRGWPGGFATLREALPALVRHRREFGSSLLLRINTVLMRDNLAGFADLCRVVAGWGVDEITFNQLGGRDRPEFFPEHRLDSHDVESLSETVISLRNELARQGVKLVGGDGYFTRLRASARGRKLPGQRCRPGERFLFLDEHGRAAPCNYTSDTLGLALEDVGNVEAFRLLPRRLQEARARCTPDACGDCHSTQVWEKFAR